MKQNIVLIGFMGAGKSVASKELATRRKMETVPTDQLIEKKEGRSITDIFRDSGEEYFRDVEQQVVADIARQENLVIDCGGGVVTRQANIEALKANGVLIYLSASPETVYQRTKDYQHRPLLEGDDPKGKIQELIVQRDSLYKQADHVIDTDGKTNEQVCDEIEEILGHE